MTTKPDQTRLRLRQAFDQLDTIRGEHLAARDQIQKDPHLSGPGRADKLAQLDADMKSRMGKQQHATVEAIADHLAVLTLTADPPMDAAGVEGVAVRIEAADARARVRGLLAAGSNPKQILNRAVATADLTVLDALRAEAQWMNLNGSQHLNGPASDAPDALIVSIDEARAGLLPEDQGAALLELGKFTVQRDALIERVQRAGSNSIGGAIADRMGGLTAPGGILAPETQPSTDGNPS